MDIINGAIGTLMIMPVIGIVIKIVLIIVIANIIIGIGKKTVRNFFKLKEKAPGKTDEAREKTLVKLCEDIVYYIVYFVAILTILGMFIDIKAILAGAGVVGLAIGFGAQGLVKDIVTGFFILFENQFDVGDSVTIGAVKGKVLELGLRTTKIAGDDGGIYFIPNGSIIQVANFSKETTGEVKEGN